MARPHGQPAATEQPHDVEIVPDPGHAHLGGHYALCTCGWASDVTTYTEAMSEQTRHLETR